MGQTSHRFPQITTALVIVERGFMGSHRHHNTVVLEIGDWLQKQLVLSANQFLVCDSGLLRHQFYRILGAEVFLDCFNAGTITAGAYDTRQRNIRFLTGIATCAW